MAEVLLRGGFDDWMEWFGKKRNIKVPGVTEDAGALVEIFQRRHLLVHNGGVVNKFYLSKVSGPELPVLGDRLHVGTQYLENSVDELTVAGVKLSFSLLQKMAPNEVDLEELSHRLEHLSFDLLSAGYFRPVFSLNDWHLGFVKDSERRLIVMVNKWIAMKKMGLAERVCIEVAEWDTATLSGTYRLAKLALIDDNAAAYSLVKAMISAGELRRESWRDWPLLEGVREFELKNIGSADKIWVVAFGGEHTHPNTEDGRNAEA
ncbi:hypothetical protein AL755_18285 [Arthrobacter sp. ERGS1:01]|nr:hypothetical protein AL755_18285 [Arthrobacter sp. ERGS1:01]